uniref:Uncharacterized protein n=1 Tax=Anguilla anguilla TaxID=7936 RepID=A0A0E9PLT6_ANGAN
MYILKGRQSITGHPLTFHSTETTYPFQNTKFASNQVCYHGNADGA